ncbi:hypothetical protein Aeh1ORF068c [Aeromonas phage Aeh1]|uniref:Uncharacterized protein n=1 Tax=Aeromonas phage Aeh1 TaxID=2880362 RepID=Q76Z18_9CAUD|nr:hypothetical protein Aeh1p073 [Aeromonas phage Aeh1]AAQ17728.1 hypothetical protein Aeh1ORF068c [Aeromonas phage Aeh1]
MTELWKINDDGHIEALTYFKFYNPAGKDIFINNGDIGAKIENIVEMPKTTEKFWVGKGTVFSSRFVSGRIGSCCIGENCRIGTRSQIGDDVVIMDNVDIDDNVTIKRDTVIGESVRIGYNTTIYERCRIRNNVRISSSCNIGTGTEIRQYAKLWDGVKVRNSMIGEHCEIKRSVDIFESHICNLSVIEQYASLGAVHCNEGNKIGECVKLFKINLPSYANLNVGDHFLLSGCGKRGRNVLFFTQDDKVMVSAGCQVGITVDHFKKRIAGAHGTTDESAKIYKQMMPVINAIIRDLWCKIIKKKVRNFFS